MCTKAARAAHDSLSRGPLGDLGAAPGVSPWAFGGSYAPTDELK